MELGKNTRRWVAGFMASAVAVPVLAPVALAASLAVSSGAEAREPWQPPCANSNRRSCYNAAAADARNVGAGAVAGAVAGAFVGALMGEHHKPRHEEHHRRDRDHYQKPPRGGNPQQRPRWEGPPPLHR